MSEPISLLEDLLHQSQAIERALSRGELVVSVPVAPTKDRTINALDVNEMSVGYIIRTQDH